RGDDNGRTVGSVLIERLPDLLPGQLVQRQDGGSGPGSGEHDQEGAFNQGRGPAAHLFYDVFLPKVFLPENLPGFDIQAVHVAVRADSVNPSPFHDWSGGGTGAALGHKSPFPVVFFVAENPENLARLFLEAMQPFAGGGLGQFNVKDKDPALSHDRTGESTANRVSPADFHALLGE